MNIALDTCDNENIITAYTDTTIQIKERCYQHSLIISPQQIQAWSVKHIDDLTATELQILLDLKPQLILLGVGKQNRPVKPELIALCYQQHIGIEVMDTGAACRTYNLLCTDGRNVVAGLIL